MGWLSKAKKAASKAANSVSQAVQHPAAAAQEAAKTVQEKARTAVTALHTEALADLGNLTGKGGLLRDPASYAKNVGSGIKTDLGSGARVMSSFYKGNWKTLAQEAAGDLTQAAGGSSSSIAKARSLGQKAGAVAEEADRAYSDPAGYAATKLGLPPEVAALGSGAMSAYQSGGQAGLEDWAKSSAKAEAAKQLGVTPAQVDAMVAAAGNPAAAAAALQAGAADAARAAVNQGSGIMGAAVKKAGNMNLGSIGSAASAFVSDAKAVTSKVSAVAGGVRSVAGGVKGAVGMLKSQKAAPANPAAGQVAAIAAADNMTPMQQVRSADGIGAKVAAMPMWAWGAAGALVVFLLVRK
jgi:hypothetical protein